MARAVGLSDDRGITDDAQNTLTSFVDAFGRGDLDALTALLADDFVGHVTTADKTMLDRVFAVLKRLSASPPLAAVA